MKSVSYFFHTRWPFSMTQILPAVLRSVEIVRIAFYLSVVTFCINCGINSVLIYGRFGAPELGITGAAVGTEYRAADRDPGAYDCGGYRCEQHGGHSFPDGKIHDRGGSVFSICPYQMPTNNGIIRGGGSPLFVMKMDLISIWCIVIPLSSVMAFIVKASPAVVVCCLNADQIFKCVPAFIKANYGKWIRELTH